MDVAHFNWTDYTVFALMLIVSMLIGIYFGFCVKKSNTVDEYLLGGKTMGKYPVALSLIASSVSGITLIGVPSEVYTSDPTYWNVVPTFILACVVSYYCFLPIFFDLKVTSVYEYLELRFDRSVRQLTSACYNLSYMLYLPTIIYVPSLCLNQVTGINLHIITVGVTLVCVFYTMIGGLKAVIWTDFFQTVITIIACFMIMAIGTQQVGGIGHVFNVAYQDGKLNIFDMDPSPFKRSTFWTVFFGMFVAWTIQIGTAQANVQRFMSLKNPKDDKAVLVLYWLGFAYLSTISVYAGLLIYVTYYGCDPIKNNMVNQADQIFAFYVLDKIGHIPMLPGFFIAGVFSAALSSLSTGLNTIAGTIYEDYIKKSDSNEVKAQLIMKCIVFIVGGFSIVFVMLIEKMGKILSVSYTLTSIAFAPVGVLFCLGVFFPWANSKGAFSGALSAFAVLAWLAIGANMSKINFASSNVYPIDTCDYSNATESVLAFNSTSFTDQLEVTETDDVFILYKISYILYMFVGLVVGVIVGLIVSFITGATDISKLDPVLISPPLRRFLPLNYNLEKDVNLKLMTNVEMKIIK